MSTIRFSNQFTTNTIAAGTTFNSNTTYIIDGDYTLVSGFYMFDNCILIFEGGSLYGSSSTTPSLILNNCTIEGSGHIFKGSINLGPYGNYASRLLNREIKAEWFGALPNLGSEVTSFIQKAIEACYATDVHTLSFASGTFKVCQSSSILIGQATSEQSVESTRYWEILIKGTGKYPGRGSTFLIGAGGHFIVNSRNSSMGTYRGGGITGCCFKNASQGTAPMGIEMLHANTYNISNCFFSNLGTAILISGSCYYADIAGCIFDNCNVGVKSKSENGIGQPNNNTIRGCMFTHCQTNPIDASHCEGWHIIDTDIEGNNGTLLLGSHNRMTNVRMERNTDSVVWLECEEGCTVDTDIYASGQTNQNWKCQFNGDCNHATLRFHLFNPLGFISYGKRNFFDITNSIGSNPYYSLSTKMVFDPSDTFILNGYSNKEDYTGRNLITSTYIHTTFDSGTSSHEVVTADGKCYPFDREVNNIVIDNSQVTTDLYKTLLFHITPVSTTTSVTARILEEFKIVPKDKWFRLVLAMNKPSNTDSSQWLFEAYRLCTVNSGDTIKTYIRDAVVSTIPLYDRPVMARSEGETLSQRGTDGIIHLQSTILNSVLTDFCLKRRETYQYMNRLGKHFHKTSTGILISDGDEMSDYEAALEVHDWSITKIGNNIQLPHILLGMLSANVEIYDMLNGFFLFFEASRPSLTSTSFTISVQRSLQMQTVSNNQYGTVLIAAAFSEAEDIKVWVKKLS